mmetsp:Transcript_31242/g.93750  ORF Transcript_31242/g.93750 Transcript_31242/m.93750 type:complete len:179 (+) Transcript_31242:1946-2482(+)
MLPVRPSIHESDSSDSISSTTSVTRTFSDMRTVDVRAVRSEPFRLSELFLSELRFRLDRLTVPGAAAAAAAAAPPTGGNTIRSSVSADRSPSRKLGRNESPGITAPTCYPRASVVLLLTGWACWVSRATTRPGAAGLASKCHHTARCQGRQSTCNLSLYPDLLPGQPLSPPMTTVVHS